MRVSLDILIVHKERVFQKKGVWFYVYDGSLPDAMLSETMLNSIPCTSHPTESLLDTRARASDLGILLQQMDDYNGVRSFKINIAKVDCNSERPQPHSDSLDFGSPEYHIARCRELHAIALHRAAERRSLVSGTPCTQSVVT